jgi:CDP-paratose 2-epimerase
MADIVLITGASGLIGSEAVTYFSNHFDKVIGVDNNMRKYFFGEEGSVEKNAQYLADTIQNFLPLVVDIRDYDALEKVFNHYGEDLKLIIHTAAQPSHDWAAREPFTDYGVNSTGTLNLLELTRKYCPEAVFLFTSTSKVYGDNPNKLPLIELDRRWDLPENHQYYEGIDEYFSIDNTKHSLFGCSKVSADIYVQEYGRYFGLKTAIFRPGCLTGGKHNGAELHGFLNYLVKCVMRGKEYKIFGYKGKQVRCNIHSYDVVTAFHEVYKNPKVGEVYNLGGARDANCSILEAFDITEQLTGKKAVYRYVPENRIGDHIWWISDTRKFRNDFPNWQLTYNITNILEDIINSQK